MSDALKPSGKSASSEPSASQIMFDLAEAMETDKISVGAFFDRLEGRGMGILLLILSLPMCVPNIPGISTLFGVLLIVPALQMMSGSAAVRVPAFMQGWTVEGRVLRGALKGCAGALDKIERLARPRLCRLTEPPFLSMAGGQTLVMALVLIIPMWGANLIPGIAVVLTGLAILQRDGLFMVLSVPVAVAAVAWVYFGTKYALEFLNWLWNWGAGLLGG